MKTYTFTYRAEVKRLATVEARSEKEARQKIDKGLFEDEHDIDLINIDDVCFTDSEG